MLLKKLRIVLVAFAALNVFSNVAAQANPAVANAKKSKVMPEEALYGFRDIPFGVPRARVERIMKEKGFELVSKNQDRYTFKKDGFDFLGFDCSEINFNFENEKFNNFYVEATSETFADEDFSALRMKVCELSDKYGITFKEYDGTKGDSEKIRCFAGIIKNRNKILIKSFAEKGRCIIALQCDTSLEKKPDLYNTTAYKTLGKIYPNNNEALVKSDNSEAKEETTEEKAVENKTEETAVVKTEEVPIGKL